MLLRFLLAAVLLAGCTVPVATPSLSHSSDCESGCGAVRTHTPVRREVPNNLVAGRRPSFVDTIGSGSRNTDWTSQLPNNKSGCLIVLIVVVVLVIASATVWR